jgi:hypothetical protein
MSVRRSQASDEVWTRALKYLLADIKWMLAWVAKHDLPFVRQTQGDLL